LAAVVAMVGLWIVAGAGPAA